MKQVKRFLSCLLALCLMASMIPVTARAAESGTCGENVTWTLSDDGVLTISGTGEILESPWEPSDVESAIIEDGITSIVENAFSECTRMKSVIIPDSVTTIGESAFYGCYSLRSITIPSSVQSIGLEAFYIDEYYYGLNTITFEGNAAHIGEDAFYGNELIAYYPAGNTTWTDEILQNYGGNIMWYASNGEKPYIGYGKCGPNCTWLLSSSGTLTISGSGSMWSSFTDSWAIQSVSSWSYLGVHNEIKSVLIDEGITHIGDAAFADCDNLTEIDIPSTVTSIGVGAFDSCNSLVELYIPKNVASIDSSEPFGFCVGCTSLSKIIVEDGSEHFYADDEGVLYGIAEGKLIKAPPSLDSTYAISDTTSVIECKAFSGCDKLENVQISEGVKTIGAWAFEGCTGLDSIVFPASLEELNGGVLYWCTNLNSIVFNGNAPYFCTAQDGLRDIPPFFGNTATAYYPANNSTWTSDVLQDYGGDITWVPYNPGETPGGGSGGDAGEDTEPEVESHDTLAELTEEDYMMFSILAYRDLSSALGDPTKNTDPKTIKEFYSNKWSRKIPTSDGDLGQLDVTYAQAFGGIANWFPTAIRTESNGFDATVFGNSSGDYVIAYCGSLPPNKWFSNVSALGNAIADWLFNDLTTEILDIIGPQFEDAIDLYDMTASIVGQSNVAVTGHSLGGGLADVVSAYSGCEGVTFNAISSLDSMYAAYPQKMAEEFEGVNQWNFIDQTNEYDLLAGMYEEIIVEGAVEGYSKLKPYRAHASLVEWNSALDYAAFHGMKSFLTRKYNGTLTLTDVVENYVRSTVQFQNCNGTVLDLGTSRDDIIVNGYSVNSPMRIYGGNGNDSIVASNKKDYLIGGDGNDHLTGDRGDDKYLYYKGDGVDTIYDIGGDDALYLYGFGSGDSITLYEAPDSDHIEIQCNGETIVNILTQNREYSVATLDSFKVHVEKNNTTETINITSYFKTTKYGSRILVACPVDVEVLDADGNVVYTLYDGEVGSYYTDYGTFYVYEEENGEYGKVLDLVEGYTIRIVGAGEGTMDVTYQVPTDSELSVPVSLTDIPVSESTTATIDAVTESEVYLVTEEETIQMDHIHSWDNGIATTQATCTEAGERTFTCTTCGETRTEVIEAWGHNYVTEVTEPTCTEQGYTTTICYGCNDSTVSDYTDALGHNYEDGYCSGCGDMTLCAPVAKASNNASTGKPVVTWEPVEGAVKYEVYRSTKKDGTYVRGTRTTGTTYTNTKAVAGKYYYYFVRAIDADGNYADSNIVGRTCDLAQPTVKVSNDAATGKVVISWEAVEGATKYQVWRATSKDGTYSRITTIKGTNVTNTKAEAGKTYYYKVRAICDVDAAASSYSAVKSRTCDLAQPTVKVSNDAATGKVVISWEAVEGATKYQVWRATSKNGTYSRITTIKGTSVTNTKAEAGKTYYYKVRAICDVDAAASAYSAVKSRTCDLPQPDVSITRSSGKPKVSWEKIDGAVSYKVYRATSKTGTYSLVKTSTGSYYKDTKAVSGKTYYYKVVAVCSNTAGNSAYSSVVSIKSK